MPKMTKRSGLLLGVDGGGTKTRAILSTVEGEVLGIGFAGTSNHDDVGTVKSREQIVIAIAAAWTNAGRNPEQCAAAYFGLSGLTAQLDYDLMLRVVVSLESAPPQFTTLGNDVLITHAGGLAGQPGIGVIVGTGTNCFGRNPEGKTWRAGGWGPLLDDRGSAHFLGLQGLIAATRAADRRGPPTMLLDCMLAELGIGHIDEIMHRVHVEGLSRNEIAGLAPVVVKLAEDGDQVALQILETGADYLAELIETVARELEPFPPPIPAAFLGGAMSAPLYADLVHRRVLARVPGIEIRPPALDALHGALLLAFESLHKDSPSARNPWIA
jgi:glucosamine kinase